MSRFSGHPYPGGLLVLDTWTGEVVKVPGDGTPSVVLRKGMVPPDPARPASRLIPGVAPVPEPAVAQGPIAAPEPAAALAPGTSELAGDASWTALDREVMSSFPYPIARTYRSFLSETDPRQRCKLLVDTFTRVIKLWALQIASEYLSARGVDDISVSHTLIRDFQRPLLSTWNLMLARCLPVLEERDVKLFAPELVRAYRQLESHCRDKVSIDTPYRDAGGHTRVRTSRLGRIQALIRYRNSLAHGYNQSRKQAERELAIFQPVLTSVLEQARFSTRYPLMYVAAGHMSAGHVAAYRLMGAAPSASVERIPTDAMTASTSSMFLYDPGRMRALPLYLFMDAESGGADEAVRGLGWDVLLFDGYTRTTVIYVSVSGQRVEKQGQLGRWRALLAEKAPKGKALTLAGLTWERLRDAAERQCDQAIASLQNSNRYLPDVAIERPRMNRLLADFERSDYRAFVVAGDNGMGKSTLLAHYAQKRQQAGDVVVFYRAAGLRDAQLSQRILRDLGVRNGFFEDFLAALERVVPRGARVRLIIDSLHEHPGATGALIQAIDGLVDQAGSYPFFRVLTSIRSAAYKRLPAHARFGRISPGTYFSVEQQCGTAIERTVLVELPRLSPTQVADAYARYRAYRRPETDELNPGTHAFRPTTPFSELAPDGATVALMRVPLFLRLLTTAFSHRPLPSNLSFDQAMEPYMEHAVVEHDEHTGGYPERRRFLQTLVKLFDRENADSLPRDRLYQEPSLTAHLTNPNKDSAYVQLLDLGILIEDWDGDECSVRFAFDGLFEYLLGELHYPRIEGPSQLLLLVERALEFKSLRAAVVGIMRKAIRTGRQSLVLDACDLCPVDDAAAAEFLAAEPTVYTSTALMIDMVGDLLVDMARFRDPGFELLCRDIADTASRFDVLAMCAAFDKLLIMGEMVAADQLAQASVQIACALDHERLHANAVFRWSQTAQRRGKTECAFDRLDEARALAESAGDMHLCHRIDSVRGRLFVSTGDLERAARVYDDAHRGLVELAELGDASVAVRGLASIHVRSGKLERAEALNRQAIELAERAGDLSNTAKALNNLAMVQKRRNHVAAAITSCERSLTIKEKIGDRASIATTQVNLGQLHYSQGDIEAARRCWHASAETFEALEHREGWGISVCNLALLAILERDHERAASLLDRGVELFEACGDRRGMSLAVWFQASLSLDTDRIDDARTWLARLHTLEKQLGTPAIELQCLAGDVRVAARTRASDTLSRLDALERLSETLDAHHWDVEEGPASAFLDAVHYLYELGHELRARELLDKVRLFVGQRPFAQSARLARLADDLALELF